MSSLKSFTIEKKKNPNWETFYPQVIEAIGRDNVKLNQTQIDELIDILGKEEIIEAEDKIEKAIAKSLKEATRNEELIDKAPIITDSGKEFKAEVSWQKDERQRET